MENENVARDIHQLAKGKEINEITRANGIEDEATENTDEDESRGNNVNVSGNAVAVMSRDGVSFPKRLISNIPIIRPAYNVVSSQETLNQVRKRLQSLHNVLRMYEDIRRESTDQIDEVAEKFVSVKPEIEQTDSETVIMNCDDDSERQARQTECTIVDSCEYFELDCSKESSSSSDEYVSDTSNKTYRCSSDVTLGNGYSECCNQHGVTWKPTWTAIDSNNCGQCSSFSSAILRASEYKNQCEGSKHNISDHNRNNELERNSEANETNGSSDFREKESESMSKMTRHTLSSKSFKDKNVRAQGGTKNVDKFNDTLNVEHRDNVIISRNNSRSKISRSSDREGKSIALLLQEALHFKKALLKRLESENKRLLCSVKGNVTDKFPSESERETQINSNDHFPSMVLDIKAEPITDDSHGSTNPRYVHVEMKQRSDLFSQSLRNVNTFARHESERVLENKSLVPETSSVYFSISDLRIRDNDEVENIVPLLEPPIYEKVISLTIPVNVEEENVNDTNEKSMPTKTALRNDQTICADSRQNVSENTNAENTDDTIANKRLLTMFKLEDLVLERVKNIRDYMDTFLQTKDRAISKTRKALRSRDESDIFRCSNEASHVILHNRLTASSTCDSIDQVADTSKRPHFLVNTRPNYENNDILTRSSNRHLKRNPGKFTLIAPIKNTSSNENITQWSEVKKRKEVDISLPVTLKYFHDNGSKAEKINLDTSNCNERDYVTSHIENDKISEQITNINESFQKCEKQSQIGDIESKFPATYFPLDISQDHVMMEKCQHATRSRYNSISHSSLYFTDEAASSIEVNKVSSKSKCNVIHSRTKPGIKKEIKKNAIKEQISTDKRSNPTIIMPIDKRSDATVIMPSKSQLNTECSNLTFTCIDTSEQSQDRLQEHSIKAKTLLKENITPPSLDLKQRTLNTDNNSLRGVKRYECDEIFANNAHLSPRKEKYSTKQLCRVYSRIKAKSDTCLVTKDFNINLYPKRSHSFSMPRDILEYICKMSPDIKLHSINECTKDENELKPAIRSKSVISLERIPTKSCIPILKNHLETARQMKHQTHTRSPTRSPLTMLRREKPCTKNRTMDEEATRGSKISMNKLHLCVEETPSNLTKLNMESVLAEELEINTTYRSSSVTSKGNLDIVPDRNIEPSKINKEHSDKKLVHSSEPGARLMENVENAAPKVTFISIMANDDLRKNYPANTFILKTGDVCPVTDILKRTKGLWTITVEKTEKEVTAKPSITDTCTSMSDLH